MKPSDLLRAAYERYSLTKITSLGDVLRCDVEYAVYCRALFHLKAGFRIHPTAHLFELEAFEPLTLDDINAAFHRATVYAEVAEAQERAA